MFKKLDLDEKIEKTIKNDKKWKLKNKI